MSERAEEVRGECANYTYPSLPTSPALPKNSVSPSTPSERSSTREGADQTAAASLAGAETMDGWRSVDEIGADLAPSINTYGGDESRAPRSVRHWQLHFGEHFVADTSSPEVVAMWQAVIAERAQLLAEVEAAHRFERSATVEREALLAERDSLRAEVAELRELTDAARLLGPARRVLDMAAEGEATAEECAAMAQRIVDLIGHPVTDEPPHAIVERDSLGGVVQAVRELLVEIVTGVGIASEATRGEVNFTVEAARLIADRLRAALAAAADAPQPERPNRQQIVTRLRDWLHETPLSRCTSSSDECDTWPLAYEVADRVFGPSPAVLPEKEQR